MCAAAWSHHVPGVQKLSIQGFQMKKTPFGLSAIVAATLWLGASPVYAGSYVFTTLDRPAGSGYFNTSGQAINNNGLVAGYTYALTADIGVDPKEATQWSSSAGVMLPSANVPGMTYASAYDVNNAGQIVGTNNSSYDDKTGSRAVLWNTGGSVTVLTPLAGATYSKALGINDGGRVVGYSDSATNGPHATVWTGTQVKDLGVLGSGMTSMANDINHVGQIVGSSTVLGLSPLEHAVLWSGPSKIDLGTLAGGVYSKARAINDAGMIVGESAIQTGPNLSPDFHATLWQDATAIAWDWENAPRPIDLGVLDGYRDSRAFAVNASGQVVGESLKGGVLGSHATLWSGTQIIDLNSLLDPSLVSAGWVLLSANGINDQGVITGNAYNPVTRDGVAFTLTTSAVPEPANALMMMLGLSALGGLVYRRKAGAAQGLSAH
jgi:probable HAF family extracellular repeat protein